MKSFLLILCFLFLGLKVQATHIVGGEIYYKYIGNNNYQVYFDFYMDCLNGLAGAIKSDVDGSNFAVFDGSTNARISSYDKNGIKPIGSPKRVSATNYKCIITKPNACVDKYQFQFILNLPPQKGGYIIAYQRCCRNNSITNLVDPGGTGSTYWTKVDDFTADKGNNNSAVFNNLPPNFLCTNAPLSFDHSALDPDGDSLVYELFHPYNSFKLDSGATQNNPQPIASKFMSPPFTQIDWLNGYGLINQIDASPAMNINSKTGLLSFTPTKVGQFVIGILVKEYRKGLLIGVTRRDFQFNVSNCNFEVVSSFFAPIKSCDYTVSFGNNSFGAGLSYQWDFGDPQEVDDVSTEVTPFYTYKRFGTFNTRLIAKNNNCTDTYSRAIAIIEPLGFNLGPNDTVCLPVKKKLTINSVATVNVSYVWSTGEQSKSIDVFQSGQYTARINKEGCTFIDTISIAVDTQLPVLMEDSILCNEDKIAFKLDPGSGFVNYLWSTGKTSQTIDVNGIGKYMVSVTTKYNCRYSDSVLIEQQLPPSVQVADNSICPGLYGELIADNANVSYLWNTGEKTQKISVSKAGLYWVQVFDGKCYGRDTAQLIVYDLGKYGLPDDTAFCDKVYKPLNVGEQFVKYRWNTGEMTPDILAEGPGKYVVNMISKENCNASDSISIVLNPLPLVELGKDTTLCESVNMTLDAGNAGQYVWQDGSTERTILTEYAGMYKVTVTDANGCENTDSVNIMKDPKALPSELYMPNAFSPNGDGLNDVFPNNQYQDIGVEYNLKIFNRWGEKLEDFNRPSFNWDGIRDGQVMLESVYIYLVTWVGCDNKRRQLKGNVTLLK